MEINTKVFYNVGFWCFLVIALCSAANLYLFFKTNNVFSNVSAIASTVFNFLLAGFFLSLLKNSGIMTSEGDSSSEELNNAFKEVQHGRDKRAK